MKPIKRKYTYVGNEEYRLFAADNPFTQLDNVVTRILNPKLSGKAIKVLLAIIDKTVGWKKTKDAISYSQLKKATGIAHDATLWSALRELMGVDKEDNQVGIPLIVRLPLAGSGGVKGSFLYAVNQDVVITANTVKKHNGLNKPRAGKAVAGASATADIEAMEAVDTLTEENENCSETSAENAVIEPILTAEIADTKAIKQIQLTDPTGQLTANNKLIVENNPLSPDLAGGEAVQGIEVIVGSSDNPTRSAPLKNSQLSEHSEPAANQTSSLKAINTPPIAESTPVWRATIAQQLMDEFLGRNEIDRAVDAATHLFQNCNVRSTNAIANFLKYWFLMERGKRPTWEDINSPKVWAELGRRINIHKYAQRAESTPLIAEKWHCEFFLNQPQKCQSKLSEEMVYWMPNSRQELVTRCR